MRWYHSVTYVIRLGADENGPLGGCEPTIQYLQKLGADYLDLIWEFSTWVLEKYPERGLEASMSIGVSAAD
jgi:hypothetical protein